MLITHEKVHFLELADEPLKQHKLDLGNKNKLTQVLIRQLWFRLTNNFYADLWQVTRKKGPDKNLEKQVQQILFRMLPNNL